MDFTASKVFRIMDFTSFSHFFDIFTTCYVYGSIGYILILLVSGLTQSFLALVDEEQERKTDFYQEIEELFNSSEDSDFEPSPQPAFEAMTIRELRSFVKDIA